MLSTRAQNAPVVRVRMPEKGGILLDAFGCCMAGCRFAYKLLKKIKFL
jgi:hypothetical protein